MKNLKDWGIRSRLILIAILPVSLMFASIVFYSYYSRSAEVQQELTDRGNLISSALADSSEYAVVSGNISGLESTIHGLLLADKSISGITVLNAHKNLVIQIPSYIAPEINHLQFDASIKRDVLAINAFDAGGTPHVSSSSADFAKPPTADTVGYVRVIMTPAILIAKQWQHILIEFLMAGIILLVSITLGLFLTLSLTKPLTKTIGALRQIRSGNYKVSLDVTDGGEIGELQSTANEMAESLHQFKHDIESKVTTRTVALQAARDAAIKADAEKRKLIQNANSAVEQERKNIAIDIHDHLNATLIVTKLEAQRILAITKKCDCAIAEDINEKVHSIIQNTADLYKMARDIVKRLRPEVIDTLGLRDAVEEMVHYYDVAHPKCKFNFESIGDFSGLENELAISAYRLIQEALSNVVKHSEATLCSVSLNIQHDTHILQAMISDNGCGFDLKTVEFGIGLLGMRERVHGVGGEMEITTDINAGTKIVITFPVRVEPIHEQPTI